jgi:hypothetical protein
MFAVTPICRESRSTLFCSVYFSIIFYTTFLKKAKIIFSFCSHRHASQITSCSLQVQFPAVKLKTLDSVCCTSHRLQCEDYYYKIYSLTRTICKNRMASDLANEDGTITRLLFCHYKHFLNQ